MSYRIICATKKKFFFMKSESQPLLGSLRTSRLLMKMLEVHIFGPLKKNNVVFEVPDEELDKVFEN